MQSSSRSTYSALLNHKPKVIIKSSLLNVSHNSISSCALRCGDKSSNNDFKYTMKVVFITFGSTTLVFFIFLLLWKHIKNSRCLGLNHGLNTFVLNKSTLDESCLIDHTLYEMLLKEAIFISSGSSGEVYKIKFLNLECAMKVFSSHARMDFRRESLIVANLDHPNIIKFFCCFRKSFIIMELMDEDLYSYIKKIREKTSDCELSLELALDVMLQIAKGMSYLHEEGIAHQDLKSLNIFLKLQGEPHSSNFRIIAKIADFGSARSFDPRHPQGFFLRPKENVGTRSWRAPELFPPRGGFLTKVFGMACEIFPKPLDIYGFAIICSELLTKQIPFSFTNKPRIVHGVELRAGLRPTLPSCDCPKELIALIEDCWHSNPKSRPEFREICTRLSQLIEVQSHEQTPSTL